MVSGKHRAGDMSSVVALGLQQPVTSAFQARGGQSQLPESPLGPQLPAWMTVITVIVVICTGRERAVDLCLPGEGRGRNEGRWQAVSL